MSPRAAKERPLISRIRRRGPETPDAVEGGSGERKRGIHARRRAKSSLERVCHARGSRSQLRKTRLSVETGDAEELGGEARACNCLRRSVDLDLKN
jgi:hypothetical protein